MGGVWEIWKVYATGIKCSWKTHYGAGVKEAREVQANQCITHKIEQQKECTEIKVNSSMEREGKQVRIAFQRPWAPPPLTNGAVQSRWGREQHEHLGHFQHGSSQFSRWTPSDG